jgi:hypothetical protein
MQKLTVKSTQGNNFQFHNERLCAVPRISASRFLFGGAMSELVTRGKAEP